MSRKKVQVSLPPELTDLLVRAGHDLDSKVCEALVLQLYLEDEISSGRAAELLGISKDAFRALLSSRGIPSFRQSAADVLSEASAPRVSDAGH